MMYEKWEQPTIAPIPEGQCWTCRAPVGTHSPNHCDFHAGYQMGYEAHRDYIGRVVKDLLK